MDLGVCQVRKDLAGPPQKCGGRLEIVGKQIRCVLCGATVPEEKPKLTPAEEFRAELEKL